jgi:hypothetical protein
MLVSLLTPQLRPVLGDEPAPFSLGSLPAGAPDARTPEGGSGETPEASRLVAARGPDAEQKFRACQGFFNDLEKLMGALGPFNGASVDMVRGARAKLIPLLTDAFNLINTLDSQCQDQLTAEQKARVEKHRKAANELFGKLMIGLHEDRQGNTLPPPPDPEGPNFIQEALRWLIGIPGRILNPWPQH